MSFVQPTRYDRDDDFIMVGQTKLEKELGIHRSESIDESECELEVDDMEAILQDFGALEVDLQALARTTAKMGTWNSTSTDIEEDQLSSLEESTPTPFSVYLGSYDEPRIVLSISTISDNIVCT
jgi:citrate lyase gamma subunit